MCAAGWVGELPSNVAGQGQANRSAGLAQPLPVDPIVGRSSCPQRWATDKEEAMQEPEARPEAKQPTGVECECPVCGQMHWQPYGHMRKHMMKRWGMMPMGMNIGAWCMGPALMGFVVGFLIATKRECR